MIPAKILSFKNTLFDYFFHINPWITCGTLISRASMTFFIPKEKNNRARWCPNLTHSSHSPEKSSMFHHHRCFYIYWPSLFHFVINQLTIYSEMFFIYLITWLTDGKIRKERVGCWFYFCWLGIGKKGTQNEEESPKQVLLSPSSAIQHDSNSNGFFKLCVIGRKNCALLHLFVPLYLHILQYFHRTHNGNSHEEREKTFAIVPRMHLSALG